MQMIGTRAASEEVLVTSGIHCCITTATTTTTTSTSITITITGYIIIGDHDNNIVATK